MTGDTPGRHPADYLAGTDTMRAALLTGIGGPEMLEVRDDIPVPRAGRGDVVVRVAACGLNNSDINTRVGWYSRSITTATKESGYDKADVKDVGWSRRGLSFPRIQGSDVVGRVVEVGEGANPRLMGRRVLVDPCLRDRRRPDDPALAGYLGSELDGGFAEYCAVPGENAYPVSSNLSDVELSAFPCSWSTAEHMLALADLRRGETVAVPGASGGVGSALVQLAKLRGAQVVAIAGVSKLGEVKELGADHVVVRQPGRVPEAAVDANRGPFHVVADVVGGDDFGGWLEALRHGGRYVTSGAIAGPMVELDLRTLYLKDLSLHGATVYDPQVFGDLVRHIEEGSVRAIVGGSYPLSEIHAAQEAFLTKSHVGKLIITI
ncbi:MAG: alcohol dehydrogenase family protein [bacterium]|nr:alcohol dehydrogenase family protein [bacterium]